MDKLKDDKLLRKALLNISNKQLPFAVAASLTKTAQDSQKTIQALLPKRFIIRRDWTIRGIKIKPANKRIFPITAFVYSRDEYMEKQETGGRFAGREHRKAIPDEIRVNIKRIIPRSKKPSKILEDPKVFLGKYGILKRTGRKKTRSIKVLYQLRKQVILKPRFKFTETVLQTVNKKLYQHMRLQFNLAIKGMK